jgi:hypothetical protein
LRTGDSNTAKTFTTERQREREREKESKQDFKHTERVQPSETHYYNLAVTKTILRTQKSETTEIRRDIVSRSHSKGRAVP